MILKKGDDLTGKYIDLTGKCFNGLQVIRRVANYVSPSGKQRARWECICKCGKITYKTTSDIKSGKTNCWDCAHILTGMAKRKDIIGKTFGYLTVLDIDRRLDKNNKQRAYCKCECICGNIVEIQMDNLQTDALHSCGCARKEIADKRSKNIIGKKYGRLTVIKELKEYTPRKVECLCDCGNTTIAYKGQVTYGRTQSCGCLFKETITIANEKDWTDYISEYGIQIINKDFKNNHGTWIWNCKCFCGKMFQALPCNIASGKIKSCGCISMSNGELCISNYLKENNIDFIPQYSFLDCRDIFPLRFDFAIFENETLLLLIEFDGKQHYEIIDFFGGEEAFIIRKKHDNIKNQYCIDNNIKLIRIPYYKNETEIKEILSHIKEP